MLEKKKEQVIGMFGQIAWVYDLANHFLSFGLDFLWRKKLALALKNYQPQSVLDLASGTLDLSIAVKKYNPDSMVFAIDLSEPMLKLGAKKLAKKGLAQSIFLAQADIEQLPFPDQCFFALSIAFGVRNLENREKGLKEMFRVLKPGGALAILEFNLPKKGIFGMIYRFYLTGVLPFLGRILSGKHAYFYLRDTILDFPEPELFSLELKQAGFTLQKLIPLSQGAVYLYLAEKPNNV